VKPEDWSGIAYNHATESDNRIHSDAVARQYGFRGGLVPGVTVYAYLVHPALVAWGVPWLERGTARVLLRQPLYDGERFSTLVKPDGERAYDGSVENPEGSACAGGRVALPESGSEPTPPALRGDPPAPEPEARPEATREALDGLRERGMGAVHASWRAAAEPDRYVRELSALPDPVRVDRGGFANPAFSLGLANYALTANVRLGPWIHVESEVRHFSAIPLDTRLRVESRVVDLFERRGHEFVDLDVAAFLEPDRPALHVRHRAIYRLRQPA
jgi:hypothetical protein